MAVDVPAVMRAAIAPIRMRNKKAGLLRGAVNPFFQSYKFGLDLNQR